MQRVDGSALAGTYEDFHKPVARVYADRTELSVKEGIYLESMDVSESSGKEPDMAVLVYRVRKQPEANLREFERRLAAVYGDNISEKRGKGRDWRGQVWKRPDFRRFCGGTAPVQGRDVAVILRKTASAAVGAFFAPGKAPGGPTSGAAGDDAQAYESPQKRRRQAIPGGLWYKMSRMASSRKSQQQTLEDEPPGP